MQGRSRRKASGAAGTAMTVLAGGRHTPDSRGVKKALAEYITVLENSMLATGSSDERGHYQHHLAAAARMFAALEKGPSGQKMHELLAAERRAYGLALLFGPEGEAASQAFAAFAAAADRILPAPAPASESPPQDVKVTMSAKEEKKRYEVRFELFPPHASNTVTYRVYTTMGPTKAVVIATQNHLERKGDPIYRVASFKPLSGEEPQKLDLVDRLEF